MPAFMPRGSVLPLLLLIAACATQATAPASTPPIGIDLGAAAGQATRAAPAAEPMAAAMATGTAPGTNHDHGHQPAVPTGVQGHGTIDTIDPGRRRVTLAHDPMPEIGWPAMTMVFPVPPAMDLRRFKTGDHVDFTLRPGQGNTYDLIDLRPGDH